MNGIPDLWEVIQQCYNTVVVRQKLSPQRELCYSSVKVETKL